MTEKDVKPRILKLYVEKSRTIETGREWRKAVYGLEADVSELKTEESLEKARQDLDAKLDDWLQQGPIPAEAVNIGDIPRIDIAELNDAGWQTFQKKPAEPGKAAWIRNPVQFTSWEDPPNVLLELVKALKRAKDQTLVLGDMEYVFSGKKDQPERFINRKPVKVKKS